MASAEEEDLVLAAGHPADRAAVWPVVPGAGTPGAGGRSDPGEAAPLALRDAL